jgi:hypothetical protein
MTDPDEHSESRGLLVLILIVVMASWVVAWVLQVLLVSTWSDRAAFGEMFGSINALFSGAALAGVVYALVLQRKQLHLQQLELKLTREELRRTADAQADSERHLAQQAQSLLHSARLSALSTIVGAYTREIEWFDEVTDRLREEAAKAGKPFDENRDMQRWRTEINWKVKRRHQLLKDLENLFDQLSTPVSDLDTSAEHGVQE